ncbi:hypothetical protein AVEN_77057-1 [Araneus ventricosus]|uniref:Uncharacterized protein n=1 Tax=Araneus ventricosus TaxID=182803 RepID=A0A4Y2GAW9_ARAVE|nr:hypothetical protein AVEN_77057-1 [Araneus ventricosus]
MFLLFPTKVIYTRCEPGALAYPRIVTRSFIVLRPRAKDSFSAAKVFVGNALQYSPVSSELYIWSVDNFSFTIKSCNKGVSCFNIRGQVFSYVAQLAYFFGDS